MLLNFNGLSSIPRTCMVKVKHQTYKLVSDPDPTGYGVCIRAHTYTSTNNNKNKNE